MFSQDSQVYGICKDIGPNKLSNYDIAMRLVTAQRTVRLTYKATYTAYLIKVSIVINKPFRV